MLSVTLPKTSSMKSTSTLPAGRLRDGVRIERSPCPHLHMCLHPFLRCRYVLYLLYLALVAFVMAYIEVTLLTWTGM